MKKSRSSLSKIFLIVILTLTACSTPYKETRERIVSGKEKRNLKVFVSKDILEDKTFSIYYKVGLLTREISPSKMLYEHLTGTLKALFRLSDSDDFDIELRPEIVSCHLKKLGSRKGAEAYKFEVWTSYECSLRAKLGIFDSEGNELFFYEKTLVSEGTGHSGSDNLKRCPAQEVIEGADTAGKNFAIYHAMNTILPYFVEPIYYNPVISAYEKNIEEKRTLPANLVARVQFSDNVAFRPNNTIDAGEQSTITATVTNEGKGTAFDVKLHTNCDYKNIEFPETIPV
ncbi:MAG: hypothetical protein ABIF87_18240, partial [Pseudomonadota bacterium]